MLYGMKDDRSTIISLINITLMKSAQIYLSSAMVRQVGLEMAGKSRSRVVRNTSNPALQPGISESHQRALARAGNIQRGPVENTSAAQQVTAPQSGSTDLQASGPALTGGRRTRSSSVRADRLQGKRPAPQQPDGKVERGQTKRSCMASSQYAGTADKQIQTDPVSATDSPSTDTLHYDCPICMDLLIAPVVCASSRVCV